MSKALRDNLDRIAKATAADVIALWHRGLEDRRFQTLAATVIARGRARGVTLADITRAMEVSKHRGRATPPLGLVLPDGDPERLRTSVGKVLTAEIASADTPEALEASRTARLVRLARDSTAEAVTWASAQAMQEHTQRFSLRTGWTRQTDLNPCPVCTGLADGVVRSWSVPIKRHTGCGCVQSTAFG